MRAVMAAQRIDWWPWSRLQLPSVALDVTPCSAFRYPASHLAGLLERDQSRRIALEIFVGLQSVDIEVKVANDIFVENEVDLLHGKAPRGDSISSQVARLDYGRFERRPSDCQ